MLGDPAKQQLVLSAMLCEAEQRKQDADHRMQEVLPDKFLVRSSATAISDIEDFETKLFFLRKERLACTYYDVAVLIDCLDPTTSSKICSEAKIQAELRFAGRLAKGASPAAIKPAKRKGDPFVHTTWPFKEPQKMAPFASIFWPFAAGDK